MIMMYPSVVTPGQIEWGTIMFLVGLTRIKILPERPDNPLKGIQDLVPNVIQSEWPRGLTIII